MKSLTTYSKQAFWNNKEDAYTGLAGFGTGLVGGRAGGVAGAALGTMILPGVGTAIGGLLGSLAGGFLGDWIGSEGFKKGYQGWRMRGHSLKVSDNPMKMNTFIDPSTGTQVMMSGNIGGGMNVNVPNQASKIASLRDYGYLEKSAGFYDWLLKYTLKPIGKGIGKIFSPLWRRGASKATGAAGAVAPAAPTFTLSTNMGPRAAYTTNHGVQSFGNVGQRNVHSFGMLSPRRAAAPAATTTAAAPVTQAAGKGGLLRYAAPLVVGGAAGYGGGMMGAFHAADRMKYKMLPDLNPEYVKTLQFGTPEFNNALLEQNMPIIRQGIQYLLSPQQMGTMIDRSAMPGWAKWLMRPEGYDPDQGYQTFGAWNPSFR